MRVLSDIERRIERERTGAQRQQRASQRDQGSSSSLQLSHVAHIYFIISPETVAFSPQVSLKDELQPELDLARRRLHGGDPARGGSVYDRVRQAQMRVIERVEKLGAKIQPFSFSDPEGTRDQQIQIGIPRPAQDVGSLPADWPPRVRTNRPANSPRNT
jgi:hypothetical protein